MDTCLRDKLRVTEYATDVVMPTLCQVPQQLRETVLETFVVECKLTQMKIIAN